MKRTLQRRPAAAARIPAVLAVVCLLSAAAVGPLRAAEGRSPFLPPGFGEKKEEAPAAPSALDKIEFRGVLAIGDTTLITLFDASTSKSYTVELGKTVNNITVTDYQMTDKTDTVVISQGGQSRRIELRKPKIVALAPQANPSGGKPAAAATAAQPARNNAAVQRMSDQEVRLRMQRVAEEIRRRRAMRRQALQQSQQKSP
ncbi:MAG: hypothetical protein D6781_13435 [Verrucomicrobia bacterium]|nr:MAG: hypothetical protein D6781_13435 [Verrucomicrobiota bacterium]